MKLSRSLEDYLEAILILEQKNRVARVKDIAQHLGVQMPSVTGALKTLKKKNLIDYEKNSFITLTGEGAQIARDVKKKHTILFEFLTNILGIPTEEAAEEACRMEHALSSGTSARLEALVNYLSIRPPKGIPQNREEWTAILSAPLKK